MLCLINFVLYTFYFCLDSFTPPASPPAAGKRSGRLLAGCLSADRQEFNNHNSLRPCLVIYVFHSYLNESAGLASAKRITLTRMAISETASAIPMEVK